MSLERKQREYAFVQLQERMLELGFVYLAWFDLPDRRYGPPGFDRVLKEGLKKEQVVGTLLKKYKEQFEDIELQIVDFGDRPDAFYIFYKEVPALRNDFLMVDGSLIPKHLVLIEEQVPPLST